VRFWLAIALLLILVVTGMAYFTLPGNRESGTFDTDPPTPYFHYSPIGTPRGRVLVAHGLFRAGVIASVAQWLGGDARAIHTRKRVGLLGLVLLSSLSLGRILIGAIIVSGALILNRQAAFLLLLAHLAVLFWIVLWFAGGEVRKRSDPFTAACFAAIVQGWFFAALFVMV
jgi:hypothetical protein